MYDASPNTSLLSVPHLNHLPERYYAISWSVALISLLGSLALLFAFARSAALRGAYVLRPVLLMTIMDAIWAVSGVITYVPALTNSTPIDEISHAGCVAVAWLNIFGSSGSVSVQCCVALNLMLAFGQPGRKYKFPCGCGRHAVTADVALRMAVRSCLLTLYTACSIA